MFKYSTVKWDLTPSDQYKTVFDYELLSINIIESVTDASF